MVVTLTEGRIYRPSQDARLSVVDTYYTPDVLPDHTLRIVGIDEKGRCIVELFDENGAGLATGRLVTRDEMDCIQRNHHIDARQFLEEI